MRFVVSHEAIPADGVAIVIDLIDWGAEDRRSVRADVFDDGDHFNDTWTEID